jgi:hypothetical protein
MTWREAMWIGLVLLVLLASLPWNTLIDWAREEVKNSRKKNVV